MTSALRLLPDIEERYAPMNRTGLMIIDDQPISLRGWGGRGIDGIQAGRQHGFITTELEINALKHAFPGAANGQIIVRFESTASAWRFAVSDDCRMKYVPAKARQQLAKLARCLTYIPVCRKNERPPSDFSGPDGFCCIPARS